MAKPHVPNEVEIFDKVIKDLNNFVDMLKKEKHDKDYIIGKIQHCSKRVAVQAKDTYDYLYKEER